MTSTYRLPPLPKPVPMRVLWLPDFDVPPPAPEPRAPEQGRSRPKAAFAGAKGVSEGY